MPWLRFLPWLLPFALFTVATALAVFGYSLTNLNGLPGVRTGWIGLQNYREFFDPAHFDDNESVLIRTVVFCLVICVLQNIIALLLAVILSGKVRGAHIWRAIIFMPTILGITVIGLLWTLVLDPNDGPVASVLKKLGVHTALLGDSNIAFWLVIAITMWASLGYAMVIYIAALQAIPLELEEAAVIDGASNFQRFWTVTLPLLTSAVTVNVLLSVIGSLQAYQLIYVLTDGRFGTSVLATEVLQAGFTNPTTNQGYAAAVSVVQFFVILIITTLVYIPLRLRERRLV